MLSIPQRAEQSESRANWRKGACLAVVLVGVIALTPGVQTTDAQGAPAVKCATGDESCAGKAALSQPATQAAGTVARPTGIVVLPVGVGKMTTSVSKLTKTVNPPPRYSGTPVTGGQPCHSSTMWAASITTWTVPPSCYATIYSPNPSAYPSFSTFGYCNWWVEALHPNEPGILSSSKYVHDHTPAPGAAMWFDPNVQGAGGAGHWAQVVAVSPGGYWLLITEMNFSWRGGGFGKVDYRYVHTGPGTYYIH